MKLTRVLSILSLVALGIAASTAPLSAQRLGATVYGFGAGAPGPGGGPRTLVTEPLILGNNPTLTLSGGNPGGLAVLCYGTTPRFEPLRLFGGDIWLEPELLLATRFLQLDPTGATGVAFGRIPPLRVLTGTTLYAQYLEVAGGSFLQSNAIAAVAALGCAVVAQGTRVVFSPTGTGFAEFNRINVPAGCTWQVIGQNVARPANGVTITGRRRVGGIVAVDFNHAGIPAGTQVSIQLEVWCNCNGLVSQHFLFARGTK